MISLLGSCVVRNYSQFMNLVDGSCAIITKYHLPSMIQHNFQILPALFDRRKICGWPYAKEVTLFARAFHQDMRSQLC